MGHDARCPAIQAEVQGDVIVNAVAGERAEQHEEREQGEQHGRAEEHDLTGEVENLQFPDEALRDRSPETFPRRCQGLVTREPRGRWFPRSRRLAVLLTGLHHRTARFRRLGSPDETIVPRDPGAAVSG